MVDEAFEILSTVEGVQDQLADYHKIMANLYLRKRQMEEAVIELKKALNFKKRVVVPYICTACRNESTEWSGRCRSCGVWNTLVALPLPDAGQVFSDQDSKPLPVSTVPYQGIASPFETV
jgi:hypothetical protein